MIHAGVLFIFAALVYLASGSIVPGSHDTTANAYVPVSLLGDGDLAFGAREAPLMFLWKAKDAQGTTPVYVQSWAHRLPGSDITFGAAYHQGILQFAGPRYFLVRTIRTRAGSGELLFVGAFGPAAGLTALPVMALAGLFGADLQQDAFAVFRAAKWSAAFVAAAIWSLFVQLLGVAAYQPEEWNARTFADTSTAANIDLPQYRSRLWSLTDWQIGYLIQKCAGGRSR